MRIRIRQIQFLACAGAALALTTGCALKFNNSVLQNTTSDSTSSSSSSSSSSTASVSLTFPDFRTNRAGYTKWFYGTCSENGTLVKIWKGSVAVLGSGTCTGGLYSIYVDTSGLSLGDIPIRVTHADRAGVDAVATITINKPIGDCDDLTNRQNNLGAGLAGGSGTKADPYIVCTANQLALLSGQDTFYYALGNDIYFSRGDTNGDQVVNGSDTDYLTGSGWAPITSAFCCGFMTGLAGNRFTIEGLTINRPVTDGIGLFASLNSAHVTELRMVDFSITGQQYTGAVAGTPQDTLFYDVHLYPVAGNNTVQGTSRVGGLAGYIQGSIIYQVSVEANVSGADRVGGIVGHLFTSNVALFRMFGSVQSTGDYAGGIVGDANQTNTFTQGYSEANVSGASYVGGIVGGASWSNYITDLYVSGNVTGSGDYTGGIIGSFASGALRNIFVTGDVTGSAAGSTIGPIVGTEIIPTLSNGYFSSSALCDNTGAGNCNASGTAVTPDTFYMASNAPLSAWDFVGSTADGQSDLWKLASSGTSLPALWFEREETGYSVPFSGEGTDASPYLIQNATDFSKIQSNPRYATKTFKLNASVNATAIAGSAPLYRSGVFMGKFWGNNQSITNFAYTENYRAYTGLFGATANAEIKDLTLPLAGTLEGPYSTGGIVGNCLRSTLTRVFVTNGGGTIQSNGAAIGGIVGSNRCTISRSSNEVQVSGDYYVGGVAGHTSHVGNIADSYNTGNIDAGSAVGGISGYFSVGGTLARSYNTGSVTGNTGGDVGGIAGNAYSASITDSFSTGIVEGSSATANIGLLVGTNPGTLPASNTYWTASLCSNGGGGGCNTAGDSTANVGDFQVDGSAPIMNWDFTNIWIDNSGSAGFPTLQ